MRKKKTNPPKENKLFEFINKMNTVWDRMNISLEDRNVMIEHLLDYTVYQMDDAKIEEATMKYLKIFKETK